MRTVTDMTKHRRVMMQLRGENRRYKSFMHSIPYQYCGWSAMGTQIISPAFEDMFDGAEITCFKDLESILSPASYEVLEKRYKILTPQDQFFDMHVKDLGEKRIFYVICTSTQFSDGETFNILWFDDCSQLMTQLETYEKDVAYFKKSKIFYEHCFGAFPFPVWIRDEEGRITWCNKDYEKAFDKDKEAVLSEQLELLPSGDAQELSALAKTTETVQKKQNHFIIDGKRHLIEVSEVPLFESKQTFGFARDITDYELLTDELKLMKTANADVLEQVNLPVAIYGADMRLSFYNSSYARVWGVQDSWLNKNPLIGEFLDHLRQKRKLPEQANFREYVDQWRKFFTNLIDPYEEMMYLPDGTALRTVVVPHPQGGLMVSHEDVTSRLELETSYNTLIAVQRETIDHLAEGVCVFGPDGRMRLFNTACKKIWGVTDEQLSSKPHITELVEWIKHYFDESDWPRIKAKLIESCLASKAETGRFSRADGSVLDYRLVPLPDGGLLASYLDTTDSVRVEEALIEKNTALEAADQLKSGFLANVSYQLRNPLNAIIGFADILEQQYFGPVNEKQSEYVNDIASAGKDLVALIDDILDLSTIEAGYMELDLADIKIASLLDDVRELASEWGGNQKTTITVDYPKNIGSVILDETRIKQTLLNLIQNAVTFNKHIAVHITVSASRKKDYFEFYVEDDGVGIAKDDLETIFKPFRRAQEAKEKRGLGIGLSLVKSIVELHDGDVEIQSEVDKGTRVIVKLPYRA